MKSNVQLRQQNMGRLLSAIIKNGPISKRELQKLVGLSWGTISVLTNELMEKDYVSISGKQTTNTGRRPEMLDINSHRHFFIGVDFNYEGIIVVVTDLKGRILHKRVKRFFEKEYHTALNTLFSTLDNILQSYPKEHINAIAFAMQGIVDTINGISVLLGIDGWRDVPLKEIIEQRYHIDTFLIHDPDCLMKCEKTIGLTEMSNATNALLLRIEDYGIGMSVMIGGTPYIGSNGKAGEIGRTLVDSGENEEYPFLEQHVCTDGIVRDYSMLVGEKDEDITFEEIIRRAHMNEIAALHVFHNLGYCLGRALVDAINLFDPDLVVLYGALFHHSDLFLDDIRKLLAKNAYQKRVNLKLSKLGDDAGANGAALIAVDKKMAENQFLFETKVIKSSQQVADA